MTVPGMDSPHHPSAGSTTIHLHLSLSLPPSLPLSLSLIPSPSSVSKLLSLIIIRSPLHYIYLLLYIIFNKSHKQPPWCTMRPPADALQHRRRKRKRQGEGREGGREGRKEGRRSSLPVCPCVRHGRAWHRRRQVGGCALYGLLVSPDVVTHTGSV